MLARSLIVLLIVLNLGVALWWLARDDAPPASVDTVLPDGVARLQLVAEAPPVADAAPLPSTAPPPAAAAAEPSPPGEKPASPPEPVADAAPAPADEALQCYALGPFTDAGKLAAAQRQLQPRVARQQVREVPSTARSDWRVWLPPQADRAAAQALVERIVAAGFGDYYIIAGGDEANSIALGRYGSEASARRRQSALQAAGFSDVRAEALGEAAPPMRWIDVASATPLAAADGRALGAARVEQVDCAGIAATPVAVAR